MADPVNGAVPAEEELVDYEEEEVPEGEAAKGEQVGIPRGLTKSSICLEAPTSRAFTCCTALLGH